jgi:hypothetical protein
VHRHQHAITKSKIFAATLAAVTLTGAVLGASAPAFAWHLHHRHGYRPGLAIGTIAAAAATSNAYEPVYECYYQKRYNRSSHRYYVKVRERD